MLFPEGEPEWEQPHTLKVQAEPRWSESSLQVVDFQIEIQELLAPLAKVLHDKQQAVNRLTEENQKLQEKLENKVTGSSQISFVHTSPDFHQSMYREKVTSIKDTIEEMISRAKHTIRISTRQMDMFADDLINLKRRNPDLEIVVLSRGPQGAEGDRKKLAGRKFELMKHAGIKLPVEKDALHSRLVVIDSNEVLVSSADLDYTQMDLEFNAGIWTNDSTAVEEAIRFFDNLLELSEGS